MVNVNATTGLEPVDFRSEARKYWPNTEWCRQCGRKVSQDWTFCVRCGAGLDAARQADAVVFRSLDEINRRRDALQQRVEAISEALRFQSYLAREMTRLRRERELAALYDRLFEEARLKFDDLRSRSNTDSETPDAGRPTDRAQARGQQLDVMLPQDRAQAKGQQLDVLLSPATIQNPWFPMKLGLELTKFQMEQDLAREMAQLRQDLERQLEVDITAATAEIRAELALLETAPLPHCAACRKPTSPVHKHCGTCGTELPKGTPS